MLETYDSYGRILNSTVTQPNFTFSHQNQEKTSEVFEKYPLKNPFEGSSEEDNYDDDDDGEDFIEEDDIDDEDEFIVATKTESEIFPNSFEAIKTLLEGFIMIGTQLQSFCPLVVETIKMKIQFLRVS